jgi:hypothetical protein
MTTGTLGPAMPVYLERNSTASSLPSGVNLVASADVNLTSALPLTNTAMAAMSQAALAEGGVWSNAGVKSAQLLGITPWNATVAAQ